jgi:hypothetical protein
MPDFKEPLLSHWYRALHSPHGVEILCSDFDAVRQKLYQARAEAHDPDLSAIALCASPFDNTKLWLVKRRKESSDA